MNQINEAVKVIRSKGVVAFPTETVYGLGADARCQEACLEIFHKKGRPINNPLIVHVESVVKAKEIVQFNDNAYKLAKLWPGPLSIVLPRKKDAEIAQCVSAGLDTVAIRIPSDHIALEFIRAAKCPIAAPSANKSGGLSPTLCKHVQKDFGDELFVLKAESPLAAGLESTIVDLSSPVPTILRYGFITPEVISRLLGVEVAIASTMSKIKSPGMMHRHYAPKTKLRLNAESLQAGEIGLNFADSNLIAEGSLNLSPAGDLAAAAVNLFACLHSLDEFALENKIHTIAVTSIPSVSVGLAINDRLMRAAE